MLHRLLYSDWEHPPEAMAFEWSLAQVLDQIEARLNRVQPLVTEALAAPAQAPPSFWADCLDLYLLAPALVNVALNHKVCVEQGLPLHPTTYFEVNEKNRFQAHYAPEEVQAAQAFFLDCIAMARSIFALEAGVVRELHTFQARLPLAVRDFVYTSTQDKYTWRASDPGKILSLARDVQQKVRPALLLGAAHGSIMSGLLLANILEAPLYFIRFSMFKRQDTAPVIAPSDLQFLAEYRKGPVLLFDEDVAKGTTLGAFTDFLKPFFQESHSAGVLRHIHAGYRPDFIGKVWCD